MDRIDRTFINALFTPDYYKGYKAVERYMSKVALRILEDAGVDGCLREGPSSADDVIERLGFHPQSRPLISWALCFLAENRVLEKSGSGYRMDGGLPDTGTDDDERLIHELLPGGEIFTGLIRRIEPEIGPFLKGRKKGADILFSGETLSLWNKYFNNGFYGYAVLNYGTAYGITKWFSGTGGKSMLEFGSGTSGATVKVFQMLQDNNLLGSMRDIVLTDVVPPLLELGRRNIDSHISPPPSYTQKILDINAPFGGQGFADGPFDIIYGVNVMHVARDISFSLREIHGRLDKDGILVLGETTRPSVGRPMHHEIIFNLLGNYYDVETNPDSRPDHGFLTRELWVKNLETAGFRDIECLTELDVKEGLDFDIRPLHSFLVVKGRK